MSSNSIGKEFTVTYFGESRGRCVGIVIDGCPAGLPLTQSHIQLELDRRRPGTSELVSPRKESDKVEVLSGVYRGFTTGAPICMLIWNRRTGSTAGDVFRRRPRPGHADYPALVKYGGFADHRGGGIFSGRITAAFVMAGAVAKQVLATQQIEVLAHAIEIGGVRVSRRPTMWQIRQEVYRNQVRCADAKVAERMAQVIRMAKEAGDSVGGVIEGVAVGIPPGVGGPVFDSLEADLAKFLFGIPAVKGVEFGVGFRAARVKGSEYNDPYVIREGKVVTLSNRAGGIIGGLSTGMPIVLRVVLRPPSSIPKRQRTVDMEEMKETELKVRGEFDPCIVPRAVPVVESVMAIVLVDHLLRDGHIPRVLGR